MNRFKKVLTGFISQILIRNQKRKKITLFFPSWRALAAGDVRQSGNELIGCDGARVCDLVCRCYNQRLSPCDSIVASQESGTTYEKSTVFNLMRSIFGFF
jgi:hypothetical protein